LANCFYAVALLTKRWTKAKNATALIRSCWSYWVVDWPRI